MAKPQLETVGVNDGNITMETFISVLFLALVVVVIWIIFAAGKRAGNEEGEIEGVNKHLKMLSLAINIMEHFGPSETGGITISRIYINPEAVSWRMLHCVLFSVNSELEITVCSAHHGNNEAMCIIDSAAQSIENLSVKDYNIIETTIGYSAQEKTDQRPNMPTGVMLLKTSMGF